MEFRVLGPLEVAEQGRPLALGGGKQRALLAVLLLNANDVVPSERLVDEVWGESPPATAAKAVQVYVSRLRRQFGDDRLLTQTPHAHGSPAPRRTTPARCRGATAPATVSGRAS